MTSGVTFAQDLAEELLASRHRLEQLPTASASTRTLARLLGRLAARLARPPRIVLLGEFNAGKTTLANALIGADVLPTSFVANTRTPLLIRHADAPRIEVEFVDGRRAPLTQATLGLYRNDQTRMLHVGLPVERLRSFELIDTPGLASGMVRIDGGNAEACARASIAIWCTASTQAWKASERDAWAAAPERLRRRSLLVATQADSLNSERDRERVAARLRAEAGTQFGGLVMVAAAEVDELRRNPDALDFCERWASSGGEALDRQIDRILEQVLTDRETATARILARAAARHGAGEAGPPPE